MRIFIVMGLPYQGKTTAARRLETLLHLDPTYSQREIGYISTDICRGKTLRDDFPEQDRYRYSKQEEALAWNRFLGEITTFLALSPTDSILILDGTFTSWAKFAQVIDLITLNIDSFASQRLPLIVDIIHVGSQYGENLWKPDTEHFEKGKPHVWRAWNNRCSFNDSLGLTSEVPDDVLQTKIHQLKELQSVILSTCKSYMRSYKGLIYFARHFVRHHPSVSELRKFV